jgi:hypothetical protein
MPENPPTARAMGTRFHSLVTTMLLIAMSMLIVRDILVRRWSSVTPPSSDVTERTR